MWIDITINSADRYNYQQRAGIGGGNEKRYAQRTEQSFQFICLLELFILTTSKVISGHILTCDNAHSWQIYSAARLGDQATSAISHSVALS